MTNLVPSTASGADSSYSPLMTGCSTPSNNGYLSADDDIMNMKKPICTRKNRASSSTALVPKPSNSRSNKEVSDDLGVDEDLRVTGCSKDISSNLFCYQ